MCNNQMSVRWLVTPDQVLTLNCSSTFNPNSLEQASESAKLVGYVNTIIVSDISAIAYWPVHHCHVVHLFSHNLWGVPGVRVIYAITKLITYWTITIKPHIHFKTQASEVVEFVIKFKSVMYSKSVLSLMLLKYAPMPSVPWLMTNILSI